MHAVAARLGVASATPQDRQLFQASHAPGTTVTARPGACRPRRSRGTVPDFFAIRDQPSYDHGVRNLRRHRALVVLLAATAGGTLAHLTGSARPRPASAAAARAAEPAPAPPGAWEAQPEPVTPPDPVPEDPHDEAQAAPSDDAEEREAPEPRPHDPMGSNLAEGRVITGATPHRLILFTFDDGPDLRHTPRLLRTLDRLGIKAVFFLIADRIKPDTPWGRRQAELAREIARRGHLIGNHTLDHPQLPLLDNAAIQAQLRQSEQIFERVFGSRPWLIRPPGGARSARVDELVEQQGYTQMLWNLGTGDFQVRSPEDVVSTFESVFERRRQEHGEQGGIILLHDIHEWSVDALPQLVQTLRRRNCALLEAGEELFDIVDDPRVFFQPRSEGDDPGTEAEPARLSPRALWARQARVRAEAERDCAQEPLVASQR